MCRGIVLGGNGGKYAKLGLPEHRLLGALPGPGSSAQISELGREANLDPQEIGVSIGLLKAKNALTFDGEQATITPEGKRIAIWDWPEELALRQLVNGQLAAQGIVDALRKRRQIVREDIRKTKVVMLTVLGKQLLAEGISQEAALDRLTPELLSSGKWRG